MTKLRPYQKKGVSFLQKYRGRAIIADEMGLGKTIQGAAWLQQNPRVVRSGVIIVCPAAVKHVWQDQLWQHTRLRSTILEGREPIHKRQMYELHNIVIINYDILHWWVNILRDYFQPNCLLIDEPHKMKNPLNKRTKAVIAIGKDCRYIIGIGGTLLVNRPVELFPLINLLWPETFPKLFAFGFRYGDPKLVKGEWQFKGATNQFELHQKLKRLGMIRRLKRNVLHDLPKKNRIIIPIEIDNRAEYTEALNNFKVWLSKKDPYKAKRAVYAERLTKLGYLKRLSAEGKLVYIIDWIETFLEETNQKLIIFGEHKRVLKPIYERFHRISVQLIGGTSPKNRKTAEHRFQKERKVRLFIGSRSAAEGITLTAASTVLFAELWFTPGTHLQAEDRPHRIGQTKQVNIYYLIANDTIEVPLCNLLTTKQKNITEILDGEKIERQTQLDMVRLLEKAITRQSKKTYI